MPAKASMQDQRSVMIQAGSDRLRFRQGPRSSGAGNVIQGGKLHENHLIQPLAYYRRHESRVAVLFLTICLGSSTTDTFVTCARVSIESFRAGIKLGVTHARNPVFIIVRRAAEQ
jgi:hypothetical protein